MSALASSRVSAVRPVTVSRQSQAQRVSHIAYFFKRREREEERGRSR